LIVNVRPAIVSVADRPGPLVDATVKFTVPLPFPLAPDVIVTHGWALVAVHAQPAPDVTDTELFPPAAAIDSESGEMANVHPCPWAIVTVCPATVIVPDRAGPLSAATLTVTVPDPLPFAFEAIVTHGWLLDAVQLQPLPVLTLTLRVPPAGSTDRLSGETSNEQPGDCVTVSS